MTTLPFADSVKTRLLATGWYANRLGRDAFSDTAQAFDGIFERQGIEQGRQHAEVIATGGIESLAKLTATENVAATDDDRH